MTGAMVANWQSLAAAARTYSELTNYALGVTMAIARDADLTAAERRRLVDTIEADLDARSEA
ncbi:hypothetical protein [Ruania rhizosphaerae]|uniref:hypothetical protein n=1 Tax=Ruania rhizosphaerae TaxID=1840413 RepID=UPI001358B986|nr:hypothetical protein [Ruania rhizosphaerae]